MTKRALMAIAEDAKRERGLLAVKLNGAMMTYFPGGTADQTRRIKAEQVSLK